MSFDILGYLGSLGGTLTGYLIPFLFVLTIVVFFHELGHFLDDLALETDGHHRVAVQGPARRLRLRNLAEALGARLPGHVTPSPLHEAGDVDLF